MSKHVCPWWLGYFLASDLRKLFENPIRILQPYVKDGMTTLDIGCGMGFFTLPLAKLVGESGKVIAVDLQEKMLAGVKKRATKANLFQRIELRNCSETSLAVEDLSGKVDFVLAYAVVHEVPDANALFSQLRPVLSSTGKLLVVEPAGHVSIAAFLKTIEIAEKNGFRVIDKPSIRGRTDHSALMG